MSISHAIIAALASAAAYILGFQLNQVMFDSLTFSHAVNWVFLPSGLEIFAVLLALNAGAVGIAIGSIAIGFIEYHDGDMALTLLAGLVTGLSPWLARKICLAELQVHPDLVDLTPQDLFKISIVFAVTSALLHQLLYFWFDRTENLAFSTGVMALGNWLGTSLIFTSFMLISQMMKKIRHSFNKNE